MVAGCPSGARPHSGKVAMTTEKIGVSTLSLDQFHRTLQARLDEASTAIDALSGPPGSQVPPLGTFADATATAERYRRLHEQYTARLRRLVVALTAAQVISADAVARFTRAAQQAQANANAVVGTAGEAVDGR